MGPQKKYHTVFMVSYSWSRNLDFLCNFIDWVLSITDLYGKTEILYVLKNGACGTPKTLNRGTFSEFKTMLLNAEINSVCISKAGRGDVPFAFHLYLSCFCYKNTPDYISYLNPNVDSSQRQSEWLAFSFFFIRKKNIFKTF